jgi:hypothetical protein
MPILHTFPGSGTVAVDTDIEGHYDPAWVVPTKKDGTIRVTRKKGNDKRILFIGGPWDGVVLARSTRAPKSWAEKRVPLCHNDDTWTCKLGQYRHDVEANAWLWHPSPNKAKEAEQCQ